MKKISRKRIIILIILVVAIIIEIIAFGLSKARNTKEIQAKFIDGEELLDTEECILTAIDGGESGYYIVLPEIINNKFIENYLVTDGIILGINPMEEEPPVVEKLPGDKIYLTEEEAQNAEINLTITYDTKEIEEEKAYHKMIEENLEDKKIIIDGYMSYDAVIEVLELEEGKRFEIEFSAKDKINENSILNEVFYIQSDITVEDLKVSISPTNGIEEVDKYRLVKVKEEEFYGVNVVEVEEIENSIEGKEVVSRVEEPSTFAIIKLNTIMAFFTDISPTGVYLPDTLIAVAEDLWNGTVATGFEYGEGTSNFPYLITSGAELAYLADRVRAGVSYEGVHFQLTSNINLNGIAWNPIGTQSNSFKGIFDGAGHTISNTTITTKAANSSGIEAYGIFGSIGNGGSYAEIRNLEISDVTIALGTGTFSADSGYYVGFVVGVIYNDAKVTNCAVKNSSMGTSATTTIGRTNAYVFLGGIAGSVGNYNTSTNTAEGHRYSIKNCSVSANIITTIAGTGQYSYNFSSGGIVGRIHKQPVWPENCFYTGTINTHSTATNGGYIGPIFGSFVGDTAPVRPNSTTNYPISDKIFSGNSTVGSVNPNLVMTSYFTNYTAKSTAFNRDTATCISGDTPLNTTHRIISSNTSDSMARYQGVNKGIYTANMNEVLTMFNDNSGGNYVSWEYDGENFVLKDRHTASVKEDTSGLEIEIADKYNIGSYTYTWYIDGILNTSITGNSYSLSYPNTTTCSIDVIVRGGTYYSVAKAFVTRTEIEQPDPAVDVWDGSVATGFKYGNGAPGNPYLITSGAELAYLGNQVRANNLYNGVYFQLTTEINLNGLDWTPIGTYNNSFRGIFDGAGHTIQNATITTKAANSNNVESYGIFGSLGGGTSYAEIKNLEISNITITLGTGAQTFNGDSGYNIGFVVGTMRNDSKVINCIVKNSEMITTNTLTTAASSQLFMGGIAGSVGTVTTSTISADPGAGHRYAIENCYVSANINVMLTSVPANSIYLSSGGIVGRIHNQPVWPENCFYTGTINTNSTTNTTANGGYIGPIFGSVHGGNERPVSPTSSGNQDLDNRVFSGTTPIGGANPNLTITSYYTNYTAKITPFNSTHTNGLTTNALTHRIAVQPNNTTASMAYYQGVNKGIYTDDLTDMYKKLDNYATTNNYVSWSYNNGDYTFIHRHHVKVQKEDAQLTTNIFDNYFTGNYTYKWYINDVLQANTENSMAVSVIRFEDIKFTVITWDGSYYGSTTFILKKTTVNVKFTRKGNTLIAVLIGETGILR